MEASTLIDPRIVEAVTSVVPVVAHGPLEHGTYQATEGGRTVTRCRLYRNLECSEHQATHDFLLPYQPKGRFRIPFTVWIDPDGKQLFRRDGWRRPEEFLADIRSALEKMPGAKVSKKDYLAAVRPLDDARAALDGRRYREAAEKFAAAAKADVPEIKQAAEEGLKRIQKTGSGLVDAARAAVKGGRIRQARPALDLAAREFPTFDSGREAVELLKTLPFPLRMLSVESIIAAEGGWIAHIRGDGLFIARVVGPKQGAAGLHERRFESSLDPKSWDDLAKLVGTPQAVPAEESAPRLSLHLWTGESTITSKFDPVLAWLKTRADIASQGAPAWEGAYDPDWRPEGAPAR